MSKLTLLTTLLFLFSFNCFSQVKHKLNLNNKVVKKYEVYSVNKSIFFKTIEKEMFREEVAEKVEHMLNDFNQYFYTFISENKGSLFISYRLNFNLNIFYIETITNDRITYYVYKNKKLKLLSNEASLDKGLKGHKIENMTLMEDSDILISYKIKNKNNRCKIFSSKIGGVE